MLLFMRGLIIGFSIAAPVGPIGMLCVKRTIAGGRLLGLLTGLGAAAADACYGLMAAFGVELVTTVLVSLTPVMKLIGALCLIYLGLRTITERAATPGFVAPETACYRAFVSSFFLTLSNPMTILSFSAVLSSVAPLPPSSTAATAHIACTALNAAQLGGKLLLVGGIFSGSCLWWIVLSSAVAVFRGGPSSRFARAINMFSGSILIAFGLLSLLFL